MYKIIFLVLISFWSYSQKAIIIVSEMGDSTISSITEQQFNADLLRSNGFEVHEFYTPRDKWRKIKKKSQGAHLFLYSGRTEAYWYYNEPLVMSLKNKKVTRAQFVSGIRLDSNALVFYHKCNYTAGTASLDTSDIGWEECVRRVKRFQKTFENYTYIADNNDSNEFLDMFVRGLSMEDIYFYRSDNSEKSWKYYYSFKNDKKLIICKNKYDEYFYKSLWNEYNSVYYGELGYDITKIKR